MSNDGPRLRRCPKGYAYAKFNGRKMHFGRFDDPQTRVRFSALKARWEANGRELSDDMMPARARPGAVTVEELFDQYLAHLREKHDAKWIGNNYDRIECSLRPVRELYGPEVGGSFSPKRLQAVRHRMIDGGRLSRKEINRRVLEIRRCFTWAVAEELVPGDLAHALAAVKGLAQGEYGVREGHEVRLVERDVVDATLPFLSRPVAALVELMWWTGARPSELFGLRPCDIDRSDKVWAARLDRHKNAKRGKRRELFFGPEAQRVLEPFLLRRGDKLMFSPAEAVVEMERRKRSERKTPLYASHRARYERQRGEKPARNVGDVYIAATLRRAITRAVKAANRLRPEEGLPPLPNWTPYQLRHAAATRLRKQFGLEMVRCLLGHSSATMSEVYAEVDLEKARRVMEQAG